MSETNQQSGVTLERCRHLRSKEMFIDIGQESALSNYGSGIFWCVHTQNCLGPDAEAADPASCKPGRSCYDGI